MTESAVSHFCLVKESSEFREIQVIWSSACLMLVRELLLLLSCIKLQFGTNKDEFTNVNCKGKLSLYAHRIINIIIIIGIQPLARSGQRPEFSQAIGMALVRCILGKFLRKDCHCFPPLFRCSHFSPPGASTSATTWEIQAAEVGTVGENVVR